MCKGKKERVDHILPHCLKVVILCYVTDLFLIWDRLGDARCPFELAWILCWVEEEESLKSCSFMLILDHMDGKKKRIMFENIEKECEAWEDSKKLPMGDGALEKKKMYLMKWLIVYKDKGKACLGIRCLSSLNKVLLGKWSMRYASKRKAFWIQVI